MIDFSKTRRALMDDPVEPSLEGNDRAPSANSHTRHVALKSHTRHQGDDRKMKQTAHGSGFC